MFSLAYINGNRVAKEEKSVPKAVKEEKVGRGPQPRRHLSLGLLVLVFNSLLAESTVI